MKTDPSRIIGQKIYSYSAGNRYRIQSADKDEKNDGKNCIYMWKQHIGNQIDKSRIEYI